MAISSKPAAPSENVTTAAGSDTEFRRCEANSNSQVIYSSCQIAKCGMHPGTPAAWDTPGAILSRAVRQQVDGLLIAAAEWDSSRRKPGRHRSQTNEQDEHSYNRGAHERQGRHDPIARDVFWVERVQISVNRTSQRIRPGPMVEGALRRLDQVWLRNAICRPANWWSSRGCLCGAATSGSHGTR
jgi:hypothetical protein